MITLNVDLKKIIKRSLFRYLLCDNKRPKVRGEQKLPEKEGSLGARVSAQGRWGCGGSEHGQLRLIWQSSHHGLSETMGLTWRTEAGVFH